MSIPFSNPFRPRRVRCSYLFTLGCALFFLLNASAAINWYVPNPDYSIARNWDERALEGIRMDTPHPPGQARNLFSYSACMYDAWAAYDTTCCPRLAAPKAKLSAPPA